MLGKLSLRNAHRQAKDYIIYILTMIISVSLIFSFNCILFSKEISELSHLMSFFDTMIVIISIIIVFVVGWLIQYMMNFIFEKRSKEFGIYSILGIEKKDITHMFIVENILIGMISFGIGLIVGCFLYQFFQFIIMNMFNQPYKIKIAISLRAIALTFVYFILMLLFSLVKMRRKLKTMNTFNFLENAKKNEILIINKHKNSKVIFIISIILILISLWLLKITFNKPNGVDTFYVVVASLFIIISIYLFYMSLVSILDSVFLGKERKYRKNNMFLFRNITSKINTMGLTLGTLALLFTVTLIGMNVSMMLNGMMDNELKTFYPFDVMMIGENDNFNHLLEYVDEEVGIDEEYIYEVAFMPGKSIYKSVLSQSGFPSKSKYDHDMAMSLSDYNKLRNMLEIESVTLNKNECLVHCINTAQTQFENYLEDNPSINIDGTELKISQIRSENFAQMDANGYLYIFVLPDNFFESLSFKPLDEDGYEIGRYRCAVQTKKQTSEDFMVNLRDQTRFKETSSNEGESYLRPLETIYVKGAKETQTKTTNTMLSFLMFYISLIFVTTAATILAIQQLSDSEKYKYRYILLDKVGMDKKEKKHLILKQLMIYFFTPLALPIIISIFAVIFIGQMFSVAISMSQILIFLLGSIGLFLLIYCIYLIATYLQFMRNINESI